MGGGRKRKANPSTSTQSFDDGGLSDLELAKLMELNEAVKATTKNMKKGKALAQPVCAKKNPPKNPKPKIFLGLR